MKSGTKKEKQSFKLPAAAPKSNFSRGRGSVEDGVDNTLIRALRAEVVEARAEVARLEAQAQRIERDIRPEAIILRLAQDILNRSRACPCDKIESLHGKSRCSCGAVASPLLARVSRARSFRSKPVESEPRQICSLRRLDAPVKNGSFRIERPEPEGIEAGIDAGIDVGSDAMGSFSSQLVINSNRSLYARSTTQLADELPPAGISIIKGKPFPGPDSGRDISLSQNFTVDPPALDPPEQSLIRDNSLEELGILEPVFVPTFIKSFEKI